MQADGIGNKMSGMAERHDRKDILDRWKERCAHGTPGMRTLGKEYKTTDAGPKSGR